MADDNSVDLSRVFLLTSGDGADGDEWRCHSIHLTLESAERAKREYEVERTRPNGTTFHFNATIEEWPFHADGYSKMFELATRMLDCLRRLLPFVNDYDFRFSEEGRAISDMVNELVEEAS